MPRKEVLPPLPKGPFTTTSIALPRLNSFRPLGFSTVYDTFKGEQWNQKTLLHARGKTSTSQSIDLIILLLVILSISMPRKHVLV